MTALALHATHNHVCAQNCVSLADVHTHAAWYLSRSVPVAMQSNMLRRYCKEYGFGQPTWDGELKGETATGAIGRKLVATFLVQEGCEEVTADVGTVVAVRPARWHPRLLSRRAGHHQRRRRLGVGAHERRQSV